MPSWFALHVESNCEAAVCDSLEGRAVTFTGDQGTEQLQPAGPSIEVFWPHRERHDRFRRTVRRSLFPGYCFARFDYSRDRVQILDTPHVVRILGITSLEPIAVPDSEIESLRILASSHAVLSEHAPLEIGEDVRVIRGPLQGVEGKVLRFKSGALLIVSIELLGRGIATTISMDDVESLPRRSLHAA